MAREAHAAYFLRLAEAAGPHLDAVLGAQARWISRMDTEWDNVRAAIAWLLGRGAVPQATWGPVGRARCCQLRGPFVGK